MNKSEPKKKERDRFVDNIEKLRDELTERFSEISSSREMDTETVKLLKEITTIIKELDKLVKEESHSSGDAVLEQRDKIFEFMKEKAIIKK